jgi:hypothetical protein
MPELDQYEREGIASDADVESLSENAAADARQAAERELEMRDRRDAGDLPAAFQSGAFLRLASTTFMPHAFSVQSFQATF